MFNIRKGLVAVLTGAMLTLSAGAPALAVTYTEDEAEAQPGAMVGGWQVTSMPSKVTDEENAVFEAATSGLLGSEIIPVAVLATQVVAGTNYAYLVQVTPVVPDATPHWAVAVVYQDLSGNVSLTCMNDLDLADLKVVDGSDGGLVGAWQTNVEAGTGMLDQRSATAFSAALDGYVGMGFDPIAPLGTQLVSGTNYKILCVGTTVTAEPQSGLYVLTIYEDLNGNSTLESVDQLDIGAYVQPSAVDEAIGEGDAAEQPKEVASAVETSSGRTIRLSERLQKRAEEIRSLG